MKLRWLLLMISAMGVCVSVVHASSLGSLDREHGESVVNCRKKHGVAFFDCESSDDDRYLYQSRTPIQVRIHRHKHKHPRDVMKKKTGIRRDNEHRTIWD